MTLRIGTPSSDRTMMAQFATRTAQSVTVPSLRRAHHSLLTNARRQTTFAAETTMSLIHRLVALSLVAALPSIMCAQSTVRASRESLATSTPVTSDRDDWRLTLTIFRSPGTGLQLSRGHFAAFVAHYPTVIRRDDDQRATYFVRFGAAAYLSPEASTSPYVSISFAASLTAGWSNSLLGDVGLRRRFNARYSGQLGAALLHATPSHESRLNPTIGLGVHF